MKPRPSELTATLGRELFDACPDDVTDPSDRLRWDRFVASYHLAHQLISPAFPVQLDFELNSTCQLACAFCTHGVMKVPKRLLSFDLFKAAIDEGAAHGLVSIKLNYINEPLLRRDLEDFIRYARSKGVLNVYFATNGLLLTRARSRSLIDAGVTKILISIDAVEPETYRTMRGGDYLATVEKNIRGFIEERDALGLRFPLVRVNFLRTELNVDEADRFLERWEGVADMVGYQTQVSVPGSGGEPLRADEDLSGPFRCSFPSKLLVIDSEGQILPCCTFSGRSMPLGKLGEVSLSKAWDSFAMNKLRRLHQEGRGLEDPICSFCITGESDQASEQIVQIGQSRPSPAI